MSGDELGIDFERYEHPAIRRLKKERFTGGTMRACRIFFCGIRKVAALSLILAANKRADLRAVADQVGDGKLRLCVGRSGWSSGCDAGVRSPFGLINDHNQHVRCSRFASSAVPVLRLPKPTLPHVLASARRAVSDACDTSGYIDVPEIGLDSFKGRCSCACVLRVSVSLRARVLFGGRGDAALSPRFWHAANETGCSGLRDPLPLMSSPGV